MLIITYAPEGEAISDFKFIECAKQIVNHKHINMNKNNEKFHTFSTWNIIDALRLLITRQEIDCSEIRFVIDGEIVNCNKYGQLEKYPKDQHVDILAEILKNGLNMRRQEKGLGPIRF